MPLKPLPAGWLVLLTVVLTSCAGVGPLPTPPLPALATLDCCWQSRQLVTFDDGHNEMQLLTVLERRPERLTLVVLDTLGRRLLTQHYINGQLTTQGPNRELPPRLPQALMAAVFLHHAASGPWTTGKDWQVVAEGSHKDLRFRGQSFVTLTYLDDQHQERWVTLAGQPLRVRVKPLGKTEL